MASYRVIKMFTDLQDNSFEYRVGDTFPRPGFEVSAERYEELASNRNRQHVPLIEAIPEPEATAAAEEIADTADEPVAEEKPKRRKRKADKE